MSMSKKKSHYLQSYKQQETLPTQITFLSYEEQQQKLRPQILQTQNKHELNSYQQDNVAPQQFTQQERQNLKNAFRYISRLAFKQSKKFPHFIESLITKFKSEPKAQNAVAIQIKMMVDDAEMISGERYFKNYLQNRDKEDQFIVIEYMIWFLKCKYLRYIKKTDAERGKRKIMKKELYLRFKNQVMLPYLQNLIQQRLS